MMNVNIDKTLPCNLEMERLVLGMMLVSGKFISIQDTDFYLEAHRVIYRACKELSDRGVVPDLLVLKDELSKRDNLEASGGIAYIASLTDGVSRAHEGSEDHYVAAIREKASLRKLITSASEAVTRSYQSEEDFSTIARDLMAKVDVIHSENEPHQGLQSLSDMVSDGYKEIESIVDARAKGIFNGVATGFLELDRLMGAGLRPDEHMVIGGRPGQGKTSLLLAILLNMAKAGKTVALFELEMGSMQIILKLICMEAEIGLQKISTGYINREEWNKIHVAAGALSQLDFWIDDSPGLQVVDMRSRIRRIGKQVDAVGIDYMQLVDVPKVLQGKSRYEQVSHISRSLKTMNKDLRVPIISCAQLSRASSKRKNPKPQLVDLRDSGQIEQDADIIALMHREMDGDDANICDLDIAKHRNGPTGTLQLAFMATCTKFCNLWRGDDET